MKKLITLLAACFFGYTVMAQEMPLNIGIHGGLSNTKMKLDFSDIKSKAHNGYMVGAFARINLGGIYLEPALNFSQKKSTITHPGSNKSETLKFNSFDIPVMLGFKVLKLSVVNLRAYLGPVASFPGKIKGSDLKLDSENVMWNGKIGVGVDLWKLTFDIDYEKGLKKMDEDVKSPRSFNFTLGFKII